MTTRFEIRESTNGQYYVRMVAKENGQILYTSETYTLRKDAERSARSIKRRIRFGWCPLIEAKDPPPKPRTRKR